MDNIFFIIYALNAGSLYALYRSHRNEITDYLRHLFTFNNDNLTQKIVFYKTNYIS